MLAQIRCERTDHGGMDGSGGTSERMRRKCGEEVGGGPEKRVRREQGEGETGWGARKGGRGKGRTPAAARTTRTECNREPTRRTCTSTAGFGRPVQQNSMECGFVVSCLVVE